MRQFGQRGKQAGGFIFPYAIAIAQSGGIAVADMGGRRVQFFSARGKYLGRLNFGFVREGTGLPPIRVDALAFDSIGALYVVDGQGRRVLKFLHTGRPDSTAPETYY